MKLLELKKGLEKAANIPVLYGGSLIKQEAPYIVLIDMGENYVYGGDSIVYDSLEVDIELYTTKKDPVLEKSIKEYLKQNEVLYEKKQDLIIEDGFLSTIFEVEIEAD